jgi:arginyl-tRNA synthetase
MADPVTTLQQRLEAAIVAALGPDFAGTDPLLRPSDRADYQANAAMAIGKQVGRPPRDIAGDIVAHAHLTGVCSEAEVAGPGFINLTLDDAYIVTEAADSWVDSRLGVPTTSSPQTVVIDYSHPNVAKEMHVGHLRSTIIGDALVRVLEFLGHAVIRHNHIGDWGTPFGMLIEHLLDIGEEEAANELSVGDLTTFYQEARKKFDSDLGFADRARKRVVTLQAGDEETLRLWRLLVEESARYFQSVYDRLGVTLSEADIVGESFYNRWLDEVAAELEERGIARIDDGALCAFPPGFTGREGDPLPLIVRKTDGGYGYQATDLAAVRYRVGDLGGNRLVYVVDAGQGQHLHMVFAVAREAGWMGDASAEHATFGLVLGEDKKRFRTRSGDNVKLIDLLDEAVQRAAAVVAEKNPDLPADEQAGVARAIGIGALKYADLSNDRVKDYVFDWDRMLAFEGNTGPYLQYAHARIRSIFRRAEVTVGPDDVAVLRLTEKAERDLALQLLTFDQAVDATAEHLQPHRLCTYLFETAQAFTTFYEHCPVLRAESDDLRRSRLVLCDLTARVLKCGLDLLGIEAPDRM